MKTKPHDSRTILCLAGYLKGEEFLRECRARGWRVALLTRERLRHAAWPRDGVDALWTAPDKAEMEAWLHIVAEHARSQRIDRIVALEESDVVTAARIREHLCLPGMSSATARCFRDKLAMRTQARAGLGRDLRQPAFVSMINYQEIGEWLERTPPPWMIKPRADASSIGIRKLSTPEEVWRIKDRLDARESPRERASYYLLESHIPGDVYHVDALSVDGKVVFASTARYGTPPLTVTQQGGVSTSVTLDSKSAERRALLKINQTLLAQLGLSHGASHAEFIRSEADGAFYFLEVAARVGGAFTAEMVEAATGVNLWREWARIETAEPETPYRLPAVRREYGGLAVSLARMESPDTAVFDDPEIVHRVQKPWHVGLVVRSPKRERVVELIEKYRTGFEAEFTAAAPQQERPD
ncbi:MAG: ATP-grasp domain-containing protein [Blastocatellia bacterium]|nr:ATP-grasp domain-containing protein [Blastocatellia bacterium]